mmetsp:Transcript_38993/g.110440  ORF Transcript_38993/g.110440 Transcript_38993/m.110440 type:complete len:185 (+) Transcript_38993:90-644(+)
MPRIVSVALICHGSLGFDQAVQEILCFFRATGSELVDTPTWSHCGDEGSMRLADALRCCYDLHSPKPALLTELLAHMPSGDPQERDDIPWCKQRQMLVNLVEILKPSSTWSAEVQDSAVSASQRMAAALFATVPLHMSAVEPRAAWMAPATDSLLCGQGQDFGLSFLFWGGGGLGNREWLTGNE